MFRRITEPDAETVTIRFEGERLKAPLTKRLLRRSLRAIRIYPHHTD